MGPLPPYAAVVSDPPQAEVMEVVKFDASKSHDQFNKPCVQFVWDFGDNSPKVTTVEPRTTHPYKNGLSAQAGLNQKVIQNGPSEEDPYAAVSSTPPDANPKEPVLFDASKSHDMDGDPCKTFKWDFGDGSPPVTTTTPITNHAYDEPGTYPVNVTATDKYGKKGNANLTQQIVDPKDPQKIMPPVATLESNPHESAPKQPVTFDASKSHDFNGNPCVQFVWDFGDNTPKKTTKTPNTKHPYSKPGSYPVSVEVTDKNGLTARAGINQRVSDPAVSDSDPSRGGKGPKNKNYGGKKGKGSKTNEPVGNTFNSKGKNNKPNQYEDEPEYKRDDNEPGMEPDEIGDEFRNITHDAISNAILDPNQKNNRDGKKLADVMAQLDPSFAKDLDPEAKKQFGKWNKKPLRKPKPYPKKLPARPLPKPGKQRLHHVETNIHVDVGKPIMPDI